MLRLYPDIPHRRLTALVQDAAFLLVLALLAWIGLRVHDTVDKLAVLGHGVREIGDNVPLVGGPVKDLGERGENNVHHLANLLGVGHVRDPGGADRAGTTCPSGSRRSGS